MNLSLISDAAQNIHPVVVHFPVTLCITAVVFDLSCLVFRRHVWLDRAATTLALLGLGGLVAAYFSGDRAADLAAPVSGMAQGVLADHEDLALLTLGAWGIAVALRLFVTWLARDDQQIHLGIYRLAALALVIAAAALLVLTAAHGGALVFNHGVGIAP